MLLSLQSRLLGSNLFRQELLLLLQVLHSKLLPRNQLIHHLPQVS